MDCEESVMNQLANLLDPPKITNKGSFFEWLTKNYSINDKLYSLEGREALRQIIDDTSREIVIIKSAQVGASEITIGYSFYFPLHFRENVFYGMPVKGAIKDFVQGRVDPRIQESPYLTNLIMSTDNTDLKKVGNNFIYYRGSESVKQIRTVDAGLLIMDEFDDMIQEHISIMEKRLGASRNKIVRKISTPTTPDFGIHREFLQSDQHEWLVKCAKCGQESVLDWLKHIDPKPTRDRLAQAPQTVKLACLCGFDLDPAAGRWEPQNPGAEKRGYHLSKLMFKTTDLRALWVEYRDTINLQDFYNGNLGLPFIAEGGKLDTPALNSCKRSADEDEKILKGPHKNCTMGVDVGRELHCRISKNIGGIKQALFIGTVKTFDELSDLMNRFDIMRCIIDGLPETREATRFALKYAGRVFLAYYSLSDQNKTFEMDRKTTPMKVSINRLRAMDETASRIFERSIRLPQNAEQIPGYYDQMTAPQKVKTIDKNNNEVYKYIESGKPDHYFHAEVYDDIADRQPQGRVEFW